MGSEKQLSHTWTRQRQPPPSKGTWRCHLHLKSCEDANSTFLGDLGLPPLPLELWGWHPHLLKGPDDATSTLRVVEIPLPPVIPTLSIEMGITPPHFKRYSILYYILYYTILCYAILYYTMLYYIILYYTILYYTILYYITLHYTIFYYTIL